jgi:hypothetical protein
MSARLKSSQFTPAVLRGPASITHVLLLTISIAMMQEPAQAQSPSIADHEAPGDNQSAPIQPGPLDQAADGLCSLRLPDTIPPSSADANLTNMRAIYTPLSARCKFNLFLKQTYSPNTFASAGYQATWAQAAGQWPHYGGGTQGWGKRLGATLADTESRRFIQTFALSTILHQDPRYFPSGKRTLIARVWYSTTRVVVTRNDNGDNTFNTSEFLGALFSSALQNAYYPRHDRTFGDTMNRFGGALSSDVIGDLLREFAPDMKRLFRKHAPKKILRIEEKLPIPADDRP